MPRTPNAFYLLEETIELLRAIEKNLALHKLDPRKAMDLQDAGTRKHVHQLIQNLDALLSAGERDPRLLKLVLQVQGLRDFLLLLEKALAGTRGYVEWLQRQKGLTTPEHVNKAVDRIVLALDDWARIAEEKVHAHQRDRAKNDYLADLPSSPDPDHFYIMVKELNPLQTTYLHPFDLRQLENQKRRSTDELLALDPADPISGMRYWRSGDATTYPGSGLKIMDGHHRTFELYRRYLKSALDGDTLILAKKYYEKNESRP